MKEIAIVILNYLNWHDTIECVESLRNQTNKNHKIIIVDNHSENKSYDILSEKYKNTNNIHILKTKQNLGYAKGNNYGILYSVDELNIYDIFVVNNDTKFTDKNLIATLSAYNYKKNVGAIGPTIIGSDGLNQNPVNVDNNLFLILKSIFATSLNIFGLKKILKSVKKLYRSSFNEPEIKTDSKDFILHGSAIFLTENYIKNVKGFYPDTFLYFEEYILDIIMKKMKLEMIYISDTYIYHKEDQSSAQSFNNDIKIYSRYSLQSLFIALKVKFTPLKNIIDQINNYKY